jgi:hypothetical protein
MSKYKKPKTSRTKQKGLENKDDLINKFQHKKTCLIFRKKWGFCSCNPLNKPN